MGEYVNREEALKAGEKLRERGMIRHFLIVKTDPEKKESALGRNTIVKTDPEKKEPALNKNTEDNKEAPSPTVLLRKKIPSIPAFTQRKVDPHDTVDSAPPHKDMAATDTDRGLHDSAVNDFTSGRYGDALNKFEKIIKTEKDETALRRIADCHYFLGEKGDKRHISEALDHYRDIIRNYPGLHKENAQATYRLAESYRRLNLHYEALVEFKNIYFNYPESDYTPESLYMIGTTSYETKRFGEAIEKFKEYIERFPDGSHVREAYFGVGDCYSRMRQFNDADAWYDNALKKWPALEDIPGDALLKFGSHCFQTGKYDTALRVFFAYLNLFPDGNHSRDALFAIARSFEKTGQLHPALKMLSLVIERYPGSREAKESALIMANIGVDDPGIQVPAYIFAGMNCYKDPIEAYGAMEGKFSDPEMEEEVIFRKGSALIKRKRYREAFDAGQLLLKSFPHGTRRKAGEKNLILTAGRLIDGHYAKKDYISVVDLYFDLDRDVLFKSGDFGMLSQIGRSLKEMSLLDHAAGFFEEMIRVFGKDKGGRGLSLDMAKIDYGRGRHGDAKKRLQALIEERPGVDDETAAARRLMGDISYEEGSYAEAAGFYSAVLGLGTDPDGGVAVRKKYADALREMGMYASALVNYKRVLKKCGGTAQQCPVPVVMNSYEGLGDCLYRKGKYQQAIRMYKQSMDSIPEGQRSRWAIVNIGRGYVKLGKGPVAGESSVPLQGGSGDEFWSKVLDYYRVDEDWAEKYGPYIQDS
ncbi:Cell division coordinator CpoB [subsurface metagenome]